MYNTYNGVTEEHCNSKMFKATKNTNYFVQQNAIKVDMDFKGFN